MWLVLLLGVLITLTVSTLYFEGDFEEEMLDSMGGVHYQDMCSAHKEVGGFEDVN
jgi:hypothetical protein